MSLFWMNHALPRPRCHPQTCFPVTPDYFRMPLVRCFSPLPCCSPGCPTHQPRYLYPRTSSGPMLIVGDNPVSGSLVSQSKCHSGGLTFSQWCKPEQPAPVCGCHPCGSNHEHTIPFVSDRLLPPTSAVIRNHVHLLGFIHNGRPTVGLKVADK